ncbi:uncharacterized protein PWA37_001086 [Arxiozyma heterogenica]
MMLQVVKKCHKIDSKWLWQTDQNEETFDIFNIPKKTHLVFGIFVLDMFIKDIGPVLQSLYHKLCELLKDWNTFYPWTEYNGVSLRLDNFRNIKYIFGDLCVEDNLQNEETLIVSLLRKFSKEAGDQVFIKIVDTDGDFLLASCHDIIPGNYEYPVGNNRLWLRNGNFIIIPDSIIPNKGLDPQICLDTLLFTPFKCINVDDISKKLDKLYPVNDFPTKELSELGFLSLQLPENKTAEILKSNPRIINYLIKNLFTMSANENENIHVNYVENLEYNQNVTKFLISKNHFNLLLLYLQVNNAEVEQFDIAKVCALYLLKCLRHLVDSGDIEVDNLGNKSSASMTEPKWNQALFYGTYKFPDFDYKQKYEVEAGVEPNEKLMELFTQFFNEKENGNSFHRNFDKNDEFDLEIASDGTTDDENEKAVEYLSEENSGINEDDFFEFFLKEALNMKDSDLEQFIKEDTPDLDIMDAQGYGDDSNETGTGSETEYFHREIEDILQHLHSEENTMKAFENMFNSLTIDGVASGPFEYMLRHLANSFDKN